MCFYSDDYDWYAEIHDETHVRVDAACKCHDCNRRIAAGEWARRVEQLQHECCQICEDSESDLYEYPDAIEPENGFYGPTEHPHYYGEHWLGFICRDCLLLREAIYDLEEKEGCPEHARQPAYGELDEAFEYDDELKYSDHAKRMFPVLAWHPLVRSNSLVAQ